MARPKAVNPAIYKNIAIPPDLCVRMELELYSDLEGKIPFGAQQAFFTMLLTNHFAQQDALARIGTVQYNDNPETGATE